MTLQEIQQEARDDIESFDSFFAGLSPDHERDAMKRYEKYILNKIDTLIASAYSAGKDAANSEWRIAIAHLQTKERESILKTLESWREYSLQEARII